MEEYKSSEFKEEIDKNGNGNGEIPADLKYFINNSQWTWATTYASWCPHWWVVKKSGNWNVFTKFCKYIREKGIVRKWNSFYGYYLDYEGYSYWGLGNDGHKSAPETMTIINRKVIDPKDKLMETTKEVFEKYCKGELDYRSQKQQYDPQRKLF